MIDDSTPRAPDGRLQLGTRNERIRCTCASGHIFVTEALVSIDIEDDPEAIELLTDRGLQNVICPTCRQLWQVAVPVTFQDRERRRYSLFVPDVLAHRELRLRADLARRIAECPPDELPYYVVDFRTLVGVNALQRWLFGPVTVAPPAEAEPPPAAAARPAVRAPRGGDGPEIHAAFADLQEPEHRYSTIPPVPDVGAVNDADPMFDDWLDDEAIERVEPQRRVYRTPSGPQRAVTASHKTISSVPPTISSVPPLPISTTPPPALSSTPPPLSSAPPPPAPDVAREERERGSVSGVDFAEILVADDEDELAEDDLAEEEPALALELEEDEDEDPFDGLAIEQPAKTIPPAGPAPPAELEGGAGRSVEVIGDRVILHARAAKDDLERFAAGASDLWIQLGLADGFPLIVLALVADRVGDPADRIAWPLDLKRETHREATRCLRRAFHAEVRLYDAELHQRASFEKRADRELNVAVLLDRAGKALGALGPGSGGFAAAVEQIDACTLPTVAELPALFAPGGPPKAARFDDVAGNLGTLADWLEPTRFDELLLRRAYPLDYLEEIIAETLTNAATWGVHIPDALKDRAVAIGLAANPSQLVGKLVETFDKLLERGQGPAAEDAARNWELLLGDCRAHGLALDVDLLDRADALLERQGIDAGGEIAAGRRALERPEELDTERLLTMLDRRQLRLGAIEALVARGEQRVSNRIIGAVERLAFAELPRGLAALKALGDGAAGQVAGLLQSERPHVRQGAAALLGRYGLRRTLMPLFKALGGETSPIWIEHARAVAGAGPAAQRSIERAAANQEVEPERLALVVALLAERDPALGERLQGLADLGSVGGEVLRLAALASRRLDPHSVVVRVGDLLRCVADGETIQAEEFGRLEPEYAAAVRPRSEQ